LYSFFQENLYTTRTSKAGKSGDKPCKLETKKPKSFHNKTNKELKKQVFKNTSCELLDTTRRKKISFEKQTVYFAEE